MDNIIKLKSRGDAINTLKIMPRADGSQSKTYVLKTNSHTLRSGELENGAKFLDPVGGPMLIVGELLEEAGSIIKSIDYIIGFGYTITFK